MMKKWLMMLLVMFIFVGVLTGCSKVDQGYEAAKINTLGSDKGEIQVLGQGWQTYNAFKYDLIQNPTFVQEYVWTSSVDEGSENDESITFQSSNALDFSADVGISFALKTGMTGKLYQKYHKTIQDMIDTNLRNTVRDAFNRKASQRSAEQIYGKGKVEFINEVYLDVKDFWKDYLDIKKIYLIGKLDPPDQIKDAINKKIQANQKALQRQNEVKEATAAANKVIETQRGVSKSKRIAADAEAYETLTLAESKAKSIKLVNAQLAKSPKYINYIKANRWDGKLPVYMGGGTPVPFINVDK